MHTTQCKRLKSLAKLIEIIGKKVWKDIIDIIDNIE